jgi:N-acylneuraminate cytidylyltransferase
MGKPAVYYPVRAALESGLFKQVLVSTDDTEIAAIAQQYGAYVPFLRTSKAASDTATTAEALQDTLDQLMEQGQSFSNICVLYATALLLNSKYLQAGLELLESKELDAVWSVQPLRHPVGRSLIANGELLEFQWPENELKRSQDFPKSYVDAGQFYWLRLRSFEQQKRMLMEKTAFVELGFFDAQDIDNEEDWQIAEWKYRFKHHES